MSHYAPRLLQHLDRELLAAGCSLEGFVVGSAALDLVPDLGMQSSETKKESPLAPLVELLFPPLFDYVKEAAARVADAATLAANWLRAGPPAVNTLFHQGSAQPLELAEGWQKRVCPLVFAGDALHLHAPGRCDLIALEVAEGAHGVARPEIVARLAPSADELAWAETWWRERA